MVADTNRWDRASGLTAGSYVWREVDGVRMRAATASELGFTLEWVEPPYRWVEGRYIHGERTFLKGPVQRGGFQARLTDVEGGTEVVATAYVTGPGALMPVVGPFQRSRFKKALFPCLGARITRFGFCAPSRCTGINVSGTLGVVIRKSSWNQDISRNNA